MKITFLGTGSSYPTPSRGVSSLLLQHDAGHVWLFDTGEGTQIQLQKVAISRKKINKIFITHLHGDHLFGLPGLLCTISSQMNSSTTSEDDMKKHIVDLYGPLGLRKFLLTSLSLSRSPLNIFFRIFELEPSSCQYPDDWNDWKVEHSSDYGETHPSELKGGLIKADSNQLKWNILDDESHTIVAGKIHHRVPSFGFVIQEKDRQGALLVEKLISLGISPGPLYGKLKSGTPITVSGSTIEPSDVIGPSIPGRTIVICGDTSDASPLIPLISECDVLVHEATHDNSLASKAQEFGHSTPSQAAEFAIKIKAKVLLLNHFSQRYSPNSEDEVSVGLLLRQAQKSLEGTDIEVICSHDLFIHDVNTKK